MPTKKPRISVTLPDQVYDTVSRLAKLQGQSRSAFVEGLLCSIEESLTRTVALLEAAKAAPASMHSGLRQAALRAELDLIKALDQGSDGLRRMLEMARRQGLPEGSTPVPVTRGSGGLGRPPICPTCGQVGCPGSWGGDCVSTSDFPDEGGGRA
jgi:hypothetical protein